MCVINSKKSNTSLLNAHFGKQTSTHAIQSTWKHAMKTSIPKFNLTYQVLATMKKNAGSQFFNFQASNSNKILGHQRFVNNRKRKVT